MLLSRILMKLGHNPRTVTFQLTPPMDTPEKVSGRPPDVPSTSSTVPISTPQVSSRERHFAELLKDLSGQNFDQLASVLLQRLGCRERTRRRKKKKVTFGRKRKNAEMYETDSDEYSAYSASFSSGENSTPSDSSETEEESENDRMAPSARYPAQTKLAPLPGQRDFKPLGPRI